MEGAQKGKWPQLPPLLIFCHQNISRLVLAIQSNNTVSVVVSISRTTVGGAFGSAKTQVELFLCLS